MNVRPKRYLTAESIRTIPGAGGKYPRLIVECEVSEPPSAKGRTVYLKLDDDDVTDLLRELRGAAVEARR